MLISSKCLGRSALRRSHAVAELLVCAVLVLVGPAVAAAQEAPVQTAQNAPDPGAIDQLAEVVVTAQFRQESAQVAPLAITAINAQMLEDRNQTSVIDIANQAPNVTLKPANQSLGGGSSLVASIRGIGQSDFDPALEPGVGMYVDDVYYGNLTGSILDLLDLDRVEVLRGPQGTLAGKNSIGGAIKLYSQQPTGDTSDSVEVLYGSRNHLEVRGSADFAILPDTLFARISGVANHQDGYVNVLDFGCANPSLGLGATSYNSHIGSCQQGQEGGLSYDGGRISLRWVPNDRLQATLIGDVTHDTSESPPNVLLYANNAVNPGSPLSASNPANPNIPTFQGLPFNSALVPQLVPSNRYTSYATYSMPPGVACEGPVPCGLGIPGAMTVPTPAYQVSSNTYLLSWGGSGTVDWKINDALSLKSITALRAYTNTWGGDEDDSPWGAALESDYLTHHQFSQELRLSGNVGSLLDYTVGAFYFRELTVYGVHQDLPWAGLGFNFVSDDPVLAHTKAGFLQTVWHPLEKLDFIAGLRYTKEDKDYTFRRANPDGTTDNGWVGALNGITTAYSGSKVDYRADVDYHWTDSLLTYAQVSTGFKGGGVSPRPYNPYQVLAFNPETLTNYELGLKSSWFDHKVRANAAIFYGNYKDIQTTLLDCPFLPPGFQTPCAAEVNGGDAHIKGAELELEGHAFHGLEVDSSLSYLQFGYTYINPLAIGPGGPNYGMVTPFTPKWKGSVGIQYAVRIGNLGSITPRVDGSTQSLIYTNAYNAPTNAISAYTLLNARLTWLSGKGDWQAALEVLNATDKYYLLNKFDLTSAGLGLITGEPGAPREIALSVKHTM